MEDQVTLTAYTDQVRDLVRHDRSDEAIAICRHILQFCPKYIDAYRQMGEAYLEKGSYEAAQDLFRRVLSADPENVIAYVGLATVYEQEHVLNEAVWHMERAYELSLGNGELQKELLRLSAEVDPQSPPRAKPTKNALARIYAHAGLYSHAIQEFRSVAASVPSRYDVRVALAEALWRMGRISEATEVASSLLAQLPYCLKANLILGTAWKEAGSEDGEQYLQRAQTLDPTNQVALRLLGGRSPLSAAQPTIPTFVPPAPAIPVEPVITEFPIEKPETPSEMVEAELARAPTAEAVTAPTEERAESVEAAAPVLDDSHLPAWLRTPLPDTFETTVGASESKEPSWFKELGIPSVPAPSASLGLDLGKTAEETKQEAKAAEEIPSWLEVAATAETGAAISSPQVEKERELGAGAAEELPEWLRETATPVESAPAITPSEVKPELSAEELPGWLQVPETPSATPLPVAQLEEPAPKTEPEQEQPHFEEQVPAAVVTAPQEAFLPLAEPTGAAEDQVSPEPARPVLPTVQGVPSMAIETPTALEPPAELVTPTAEPEKETIAQAPTSPQPQPAAEAGESAMGVAPSVVQPQAESIPSTEPATATPAVGIVIPLLPPSTQVAPPVEVVEAVGAEPLRVSPPEVSAVPEPRRKRPAKGYEHLVLAREHRDAHRMSDALVEYDYLVQHVPRLVNQVIQDLEKITQRLDAPLEAHRILGDAYARVDRLSDALECYRFVLEHVSS